MGASGRRHLIPHCPGPNRKAYGQIAFAILPDLLQFTHLGSRETRLTRASRFASISFGASRAGRATLARWALEEEKQSSYPI